MGYLVQSDLATIAACWGGPVDEKLHTEVRPQRFSSTTGRREFVKASYWSHQLVERLRKLARICSVNEANGQSANMYLQNMKAGKSDWGITEDKINAVLEHYRGQGRQERTMEDVMRYGPTRAHHWVSQRPR